MPFAVDTNLSLLQFHTAVCINPLVTFKLFLHCFKGIQYVSVNSRKTARQILPHSWSVSWLPQPGVTTLSHYPYHHIGDNHILVCGSFPCVTLNYYIFLASRFTLCVFTSFLPTDLSDMSLDPQQHRANSARQYDLVAQNLGSRAKHLGMNSRAARH